MNLNIIIIIIIFLFCKVIDFDFVADPATTTITHGNTLLLRCVPPRSYPIAVTITWYVNYTRVVAGGAISITADNSLRITSITRSSEGVYFCQAYNSVTKESRSSRTATVSVRGLALFILSFFQLFALVWREMNANACVDLQKFIPFLGFL